MPYFSTSALIGIAACIAVLALYILLYNRLRRLWVKVEEGSAGIDVALEKRFDLLSEELEAVKKYLSHEKEVYTSVTALRSGTALDGRALDRQEQLSRQAIEAADAQLREHTEAVARIGRSIEQSRLSGSSSPRSQRRQEARRSELAQHTALRESAAQHKLGLLTDVHRQMAAASAGIDALAEQYPVLYSSNTMQHFQRSVYDAEEHLQAARRLYNANASMYNQLRAAFPYSLIAALHGMEKADFYETEAKKRSFQVDFDDK